ncbi:MAG: MarR family winged helix-turn-helix transcriptional regulator [Desulforhopalus sp.]
MEYIFNDKNVSTAAHDVTANRVLSSLRRIIQANNVHSRQLVRQYGITTPQLLILRQIEAEGALTVSQLAKAISLKQTTVTDILNRLEKKELVHRRRDDHDRRKVLIEETNRGRALLDSAPPPLQERFQDKFQDLKPWVQSMILTSLQLLESLMVEEELSAHTLRSTSFFSETEEPNT